jgi:hypothetical protein
MKSNDKTRWFTNPYFCGTPARPRGRLLHYSKLVLLVVTTRASATPFQYSSSPNPTYRHFYTQLRFRQTCLKSANLTTTSPTRDPNLPNQKIKPTPTTLHYCFATALLLLLRQLSLSIAPPLILPLPLPHPPGIMMSFPRLADPAISAAGLGSSLPQPLTKFDPGPTTHPSIQLPNIMRDTFTTILHPPKL